MDRQLKEGCSRMQDRYRAYADLALSVGLNLQAGQRLFLTAPIVAADLVRVVAAAAYERGAILVEVNWTDDDLTLARFHHAPRDSFAEFPTWRAEAMLAAARRGDAFLSLRGTDPALLKDEDPALVTTVQRTQAEHSRPYLSYITGHKVNWCVLSVPIDSWARRIFPDVDDPIEDLWQAIGRACRLEEADPVAAWTTHLQQLAGRAAQLTDAAYDGLRFVGPGTDLKVGLIDGHKWIGGQSTTESGITFTPNVPTEEVFTTPHRQRVEGTVAASKPLNYAGNLIEEFHLRFAGGRVVEIKAAAGQDVLQGLIDTDEGASRLGEVALVPASSPIAATGLLFYNTLFDENAASHVALGKAYDECVRGADEMTAEALLTHGVNDSLTHVDFMIGGSEMDVFGLRADGAQEPLMTQGEWVD
ncbi:MAG: aminopeptidase [Gemmatimonadetes bacterium]|nr:aminopeptidase [Gemmatimonadota bacterium]MBT5058341.1 aminopeptidase [Gemmatimonadota bacterium]MBT5141482.1 aminopeptidase [Gemmatimonadota bacterium]MBT5965150.1 aminopeptidase [Gemmatimonadota bacterium]MBT6625961.1 aminopeptidase [Gemmatimonadota bacterium]